MHALVAINAMKFVWAIRVVHTIVCARVAPPRLKKANASVPATVRHIPIGRVHRSRDTVKMMDFSRVEMRFVYQLCFAVTVKMIVAMAATKRIVSVDQRLFAQQIIFGVNLMGCAYICKYYFDILTSKRCSYHNFYFWQGATVQWE